MNIGLVVMIIFLLLIMVISLIMLIKPSLLVKVENFIIYRILGGLLALMSLGAIIFFIWGTWH